MSDKPARITSKPSISFAGAFPAKMCQAQAQARALLEAARDCGITLLASSTSASPDGSSSKTSQAAPDDGSTPSVASWASSAMRAYRSRCRRAMLELRTVEPGYSLLPTPTVSDSKAGWPDNRERLQGKKLANVIAKLLPTPTAGDAKASGSRTKPGSRAHPGISLTDAVIHGQQTGAAFRDRKRGAPRLSPRFVEWMMGLPLDWTAPQTVQLGWTWTGPDGNGSKR